jgi:D-alanyl-D-alanine carboxypeptidase/D-alanyl-D-alanine-endopeptidase (penicillin-binding protein 4)
LGGGGGDKTHFAETPASEIGRDFSPGTTGSQSIRALAPGICIRFSTATATLSLAIIAAISAQAQTPPAAPSLATQIAALISPPDVSRDHWGILVTTLDGTPIYALNEAQLFQPDSNAKLFTTAAAIALLGPDKTFETRVAARRVSDTFPTTLDGDIVLIGGGDPNLSARSVPYELPAQRLSKPSSQASLPPDPLRYLAGLADQVAAKGLKVVTGDVIGDDTLFPWEPYPMGWAIDDTIWGYGAPVSALSVNDNQLQVTITPGADRSRAPTVSVLPALAYYLLDTSDLLTSAAGTGSHISIDRPPGSKVLLLSGGIAMDSPPDIEEVAIADPAEYAAAALKEMLEARGIEVGGKATARHWISGSGGLAQEARQTALFYPIYPRRGFYCGDCGRQQLEAGEEVIATHTSASLLDDLTITNKVSQNLHAEILLRHLGKELTPVGSSEEGTRVVREFLIRAGLDPNDFLFYDGSGLSGHDLVSPRAIAKLLSYAAHDPKTGAPQPWFADWKASLPVGGVDGSLDFRFTKPPLKGHVFAKTGTHSEGRALSGYLDCASGRTVIFSILVNNHLPGSNVDRDAMDKIVAAIAAAE